MIKHAMKAHKELSDVKQRQYDGHHSNTKSYHSLFEALMLSRLPEEEKRPKRMAHEGFEVILGGSDTTARTMGIAFYHIVANKDISLRLRRELEEAIPDPYGRVDLKTLESLSWLVSFIH